MSEYERQVEEALARKSREAKSGRKSVQSEEQLINSLTKAFSEKGSKTGSDSRFTESAGKDLEKQLVESSLKKESVKKINLELQQVLVKNVKPEPPTEKSGQDLTQGMKEADNRMRNETVPVRQPAERAGWLDLNANAVPSEQRSEEPLRYQGSYENSSSTSRRMRSVIFAVVLAVFLAAAGISGGLYYALFTYQPMADAVNSSACVSVFEDDFISAMNNEAGEEGLTFTRDMLVGGQTIRDIKSSLEAAYRGGTFSPDCEKMAGRIEEYAEGSGDAAALAAKAGEYYSSMIEAAPEATWFGQTGSLRLILLVLLTGSALGSIVILLLLMRQKRGSSAAGFSFAGAALFLEIICIVVMITGIFRRYSAAYSYIAVLSTKYMMGGIIACMVIGAFYMVMAIEAALVASKRIK